MKKITEEQLEKMIQDGKALELNTRSDVKEKMEECIEKGVSYSTFSLMCEGDFFYLNGVHFINTIGYVFVEGEYTLIEE